MIQLQYSLSVLGVCTWADLYLLVIMLCLGVLKIVKFVLENLRAVVSIAVVSVINYIFCLSEIIQIKFIWPHILLTVPLSLLIE